MMKLLLQTSPQLDVEENKILAQRGISLGIIPEQRKLGYEGVVVRGDFCGLICNPNRFDIKEPTAHFRRLR